MLFSRIHKESGISILAEDMYVSLLGWPGIGLRNVDVSIPLGTSTDLDLFSERLILRVGLGSLFPPSPSVSLSMKKLKKGGDLFIKFSQTATKIDASIEGDTVDLSQLRLSSFPSSVDGILTAETDIATDTADLAQTSGTIDLGIKKLKLPNFPIPAYGFVIPAMMVGPLRAKIRIRNGTMELQTFQFGGDGSDLSGTLSGDIRLGQTFYNSALNVTLKLNFSEQIKNNSQSITMLSFLNSFKNEKTGGYAIKCSKSVPELVNCLLVPEKVAD